MIMWLFAATLCAQLLVHNGGLSGLDGETYYEVARSVIDQQRLDVDKGFNTVTGVGGHQYAKSNFGLPLLAAGVYFVSAPVSWVTPAHSQLIRMALVGASMTVLISALIIAVYLLARTLSARPSSALIVGIGAVAGTFVLPYSKEFFAEPMSALGIVIAIERALAGRPVAAGSGLAVAVLARAQSLLFIPAVLLVIARQYGVRDAMRAAWPVGAGIVLTVGYNVARFGNPLEFGYPTEGFTMPFLRGAHLLLLEPSKSVFVFVPVAVLVPWAFLRLWHQNRNALFLIGSTLALTFAVAVLWHNPNGGWCWGPRLLIPGVVPAVAALGPWIDTPRNRQLAIALFVVGFAVSAPAVAVSTQIQQLDVPSPAGGVWPPDLGLPAVGRQAELVPVAAAYTVNHLFERKTDGRNNLRYLTLWQLGLTRVFGPSGLVVALTVSLVLILVGAWTLTRCRAAYSELQTARRIDPPDRPSTESERPRRSPGQQGGGAEDTGPKTSFTSCRSTNGGMSRARRCALSTSSGGSSKFFGFVTGI